MFARIALLFLLTAVAATMAMVSLNGPGALSNLRFSSAAAEEEKWIMLRDSIEVRFLGALDVTPDGGGTPEVVANFALKDQSLLEQHEKLIASADQLFGRFVLVAAEKGKRKRAGINFLISESGSGATKVQMFEDFHYARQENGVWLREAGSEPWKIAQDPNWVHPESEKVELPGLGPVEIDFVGSIFGPPTATKSLGIEMRTATSVKNVNGKYAEIRAIWYALDRAKLKADGYDFVEIQNFTDKKAGYFQVREYVYLRIARPAGGEWPEVPVNPNADPNAPLTASLDPRFAVGKAAAESGEPTMVRVALQPSAAVAAAASGGGLGPQGGARVPMRAQLRLR